MALSSVHVTGPRRCVIRVAFGELCHSSKAWPEIPVSLDLPQGAQASRS